MCHIYSIEQKQKGNEKTWSAAAGQKAELHQVLADWTQHSLRAEFLESAAGQAGGKRLGPWKTHADGAACGGDFKGWVEAHSHMKTVA